MSKSLYEQTKVEEDKVTEEPATESTTLPKEENITPAKTPVKSELDAEDPFASDIVTPQEPEYLYQPRTVEGNYVGSNAGVRNAPFPFKKSKRPVIDYNLPITNSDQNAIINVRGTLTNVIATLERLPDDIVESDKLTNWAALVDEAVGKTALPGEQLYEATIRKGSMWVNMVNVGSPEDPKHVGMISDRKGINPRDVGDKATKIIAAFTNSMGIGSPDYVPLWHTGIWLKLSVPTTVEFAALDEAIINDKIIYGNMTYGQIFSNDSAIFRKRIADFILDHVEWSTAPGGDDPDYLKSIIRTTDIDQLAWGMALTRYPDGFDIAQPCTVNPTECQHVVEGRIDLRSLSFTDENKLTDKQKRLMNNPRRRLTEEEFKAYHEEFNYSGFNRIVLTRPDEEQDEELLEVGQVTNGSIINIEIPTLDLEEDYAYNWINDLKRDAEEVFREKKDEKARNERILQLAQRTNFKTHGQWVKSIEIYRDGELVDTTTDPAEIDQLLQYMSGDNEYNKQFKEAINKFIVNNILTIIGFTNYECPNCKKKHDTAEGAHYIVLPINVNTVFFTLIRCLVMKSIPQTM